MEIIGTKARLLLEDNTLSITRFDDIEKYIKTEDVNSREHLHFTGEKIMYAKSAEPYTQLLEKFAQAALKHDRRLSGGKRCGRASFTDALCGGILFGM